MCTKTNDRDFYYIGNCRSFGFDCCCSSFVFINGEVFKCSNINEQTVIDFCNKRQLKVNHKNHIFAEQLMALSFIKENI